MHCTNCGELLPDSAKFCTSCGHRVQTVSESPIQENVTADPEPASEPADAAVESPAAPVYASQGYTSANAQLPPSYSDPNYSSQPKAAATVAAPPASNGLAIAGFVCSLILLPIFPIGLLSSVAGFILSLMGLSAAKKLPENKGHGLALAGTIISAIRIALRIIFIIFMLALAVRGIGYAGHELFTNWSEYMPYSF